AAGPDVAEFAVPDAPAVVEADGGRRLGEAPRHGAGSEEEGLLGGGVVEGGRGRLGVRLGEAAFELREAAGGLLDRLVEAVDRGGEGGELLVRDGAGGRSGGVDEHAERPRAGHALEHGSRDEARLADGGDALAERAVDPESPGDGGRVAFGDGPGEPEAPHGLVEAAESAFD